MNAQLPVGTRVRMTSAEVARLVGIQRKGVDTARLRGHLRGIPCGKRHWVYDPADVLEWLRKGIHSDSPRSALVASRLAEALAKLIR